MRILALDTTTDVCSIALADVNGLMGEYNFAHKMDLSQRLMPNIIRLLGDFQMAMEDVEAVGVSLGPGSFTGLRIGVVTAKTIAHVRRLPVAGVVSLDLLAHQFDYLDGTVICPLIKVHKGEVYYAFFHAVRGAIQRLSEYEAGPIAEVVRWIEESPEMRNAGDVMRNAKCVTGGEEVIFCGDGLKESLPSLKEALGDRVIAAPQWLSYPKASILARLCLEKIAAGESADPLSLVPFYIRRSAPEVRMECR